MPFPSAFVCYVLQVSKAFNLEAGLFKDGTDPDDVYQGVLGDGWLLSAISIVAASGGVGDDQIDELVDNLFVTKDTTYTGMYAVRLYKNAQWETVVLDDYFPALKDSVPQGNGNGAAFAHSTGMDELWVPLIEKACAKYYGSYGELEQGFVHHALTDLTGADAEEIYLASASHGANKLVLWNTMMRFKRNGYLMGAGTVMPNSNDRELMDSGLVFGSAYVVYDVRSVDGKRLIKLRNPPGDHGEWKGDWGDKSPLWTKRLKKKLEFSDDEDDGCFWMSFDDFTLAFRSLYVCRWFDPDIWHKEVVTGWWKGPTAAGLPSRHNPSCKIQSNPQFSLRITRPTDVSINISQSLPDLALDNDPHPIAVYVVSTRAVRKGLKPYVPHTSLANIDLGVTVDGEDDDLDTRGETTDRQQERLRVLDSLGRENKHARRGGGEVLMGKAQRVRALTNANVVASSGQPVRKREIQLYATLQPGMYTILVAAYQKGMEGPFTLTLHSNYEVDLNPAVAASTG